MEGVSTFLHQWKGDVCFLRERKRWSSLCLFLSKMCVCVCVCSECSVRVVCACVRGGGGGVFYVASRARAACGLMSRARFQEFSLDIPEIRGSRGPPRHRLRNVKGVQCPARQAYLLFTPSSLLLPHPPTHPCLDDRNRPCACTQGHPGHVAMVSRLLHAAIMRVHALRKAPCTPCQAHKTGSPRETPSWPRKPRQVVGLLQPEWRVSRKSVFQPSVGLSCRRILTPLPPGRVVGLLQRSVTCHTIQPERERIGVLYRRKPSSNRPKAGGTPACPRKLFNPSCKTICRTSSTNCHHGARQGEPACTYRRKRLPKNLELLRQHRHQTCECRYHGHEELRIFPSANSACTKPKISYLSVTTPTPNK